MTANTQTPVSKALSVMDELIKGLRMLGDAYGPRWRASPSTRFAVFAVPALIAIAGCHKDETLPVPGSPAPSSPPDARPIEVGWADVRTGSGIGVLVDAETGCQYIHVKLGYDGALFPRLAADGRPMCGKAAR